MKITLKMMALVAVAAGLAFVSCQKEDSNNGGSNGGNNGGGNNGGGNNGGGTTPSEWVDLGLPSGLLWASCNLGATSPEEYGDYYAWGETTTKEVYAWSTYAYGNAYNALTKYCTNQEYGHNGFTDNLTTLEAMDDVATQKLDSGARMPTADEWRELIDNTEVEWTTVNGVNGRKFTAANGDTLFLPAAGQCLGSEPYGAGSKGYYWSSSLYESAPYSARYFYFSSDGQVMDQGGRLGGFSVRAVRPQN